MPSVVMVMNMKKTENISFRTNAETKKLLEAYAADKKWSLSQLVELIVREWAEKQEKKK